MCCYNCRETSEKYEMVCLRAKINGVDEGFARKWEVEWKK